MIDSYYSKGEVMVSKNWQYATIALAGLVVVQAWWWNKKAPEVLNLGAGS